MKGVSNASESLRSHKYRCVLLSFIKVLERARTRKPSVCKVDPACNLTLDSAGLALEKYINSYFRLYIKNTNSSGC